MEHILAHLQDKVSFYSSAKKDDQEHTKSKRPTREREVGTFVREASDVPLPLKEIPLHRTQ